VDSVAVPTVAASAAVVGVLEDVRGVVEKVAKVAKVAELAALEVILGEMTQHESICQTLPDNCSGRCRCHTPRLRHKTGLLQRRYT